MLCWLASAQELRGDHALAAQLREQAGTICRRLGAPPMSIRAVRTADGGPLTAREREIVELVAQGKANRQIAEELFISEKTVSRHLANVYVKLGVGSRTAAAAWWHERAAPRAR